jgi:glycine cleavage system H protein
VIAVNEDLADSPELVNSDPYGAGWLIDLQVDAAALSEGLSGLLDADGYRATLDE